MSSLFAIAVDEQTFVEMLLNQPKVGASTERVLYVTQCIVRACNVFTPRKYTFEKT